MIRREHAPHTASSLNYVLAIVLVASTFALYTPTFHFDFVNFDDPDYVYGNPNIRAGLSAKTVVWAFTTGYQGVWQPLAWLSHALDWHLYGDNPGGHHSSSVLIHVMTTVLVFTWLGRATRLVWPSFFVAAVFGWHPLHIESVAWVSERKDVLCALFFVLGLVFYTEYRRKPSAMRYAAITVCLALALFAKPMAVTFPCVLLLLDVWPFTAESWRRRIVEKIPWFAMVIMHSPVAYLVQRMGKNTVDLQSLPLGPRLENAAASYLTYAIKTFAPTNLSVFYPYPAQGPTLWYWMAGTAFVSTGSAFAVMLLRRAPFFFTGWFWFIGMLLPVIGLIQVGRQSHADRYMYLPMIGFSIAVVWSLYALSQRSKSLRAILLTCAFVVLLLCPIATWQLLPVWRNSETLFSHAIAVTRNNSTAHFNLGGYYYSVADYEKAAAHTAEALRLNAKDSNALINLGLIQSRRGLWAEAEGLWRTALDQKPDHAETHALLGQALEIRGDIQGARQEYEECIRIDPAHARGQELLGGALLKLGHGEEAAEAYRKAISLAPSRAGAWASLGVSLCSSGKAKDSLPCFIQALELDPDNPDARYYYARALLDTADIPGARTQLNILIDKRPDHAEARALLNEIGR